MTSYPPRRDSVKHYDTRVVRSARDTPGLWRHGLSKSRLGGYPAVKPEVEAAGCSWVDGVVTDRNLVTAQAWPDHPEWIAQFLDLLGDEIRHDEPVAADDD